MHTDPIGYFITFTTYGTWLHGDDRGSNSRNPSGRLSPNPRLERSDERQLLHDPVKLNAEQRECVRLAIEGVCRHRRWHAHVVEVRSNHVHVVVQAAGVEPRRVMNDFKAWSTRRLREAGLVDESKKVWTRGGSGRYLWDDGDVQDACAYVALDQDRYSRGGSGGG